MSKELNNILSGSGLPLEDILKKYLNNELSEAEKYEVEKAMLDDPLLEEAMEGLQNFPTANISKSVGTINRNLKKTISKNRGEKHRSKISSQAIAIFAIILIILLCVIAYLIIRKLS